MRNLSDPRPSEMSPLAGGSVRALGKLAEQFSIFRGRFGLIGDQARNILCHRGREADW